MSPSVRPGHTVLFYCEKCRSAGKLVTFHSESDRDQHKLDVHSKEKEAKKQ
jgi:hypothetical protein